MTKRFDIFSPGKIHGIDFRISPAISSLVKQQARINKLVDSPALKLIREQQTKFSNMVKSSGFAPIEIKHDQFSNMLNSPVIDTLNKQQIKADILLNSSIFRSIKSKNMVINSFLSSPALDSLLKERNKFTHQLSASVLNSLKIAPDILVDLSNINFITKSLQKNTISPETIKILEESFSLNLFRDVDNENITLDETIDIVQKSFSEKLQSTAHGLISFEGMLQILVAIILFIYTQESSVNRDEDIAEKMKELEFQVMEQLAQLLPKNELTVYYIVKRAVNLRASHNTKSTIISVLYRNQRVELIERNKKWIYVKYFDHISGVQKMGWVYKKYLQMEK